MLLQCISIFHYLPSSVWVLPLRKRLCFSWKIPLHLLGHEKDVRVAEIMKDQFRSGSTSSCLCGWGMSGQVELHRRGNQEGAGDGDAQRTCFSCWLRVVWRSPRDGKVWAPCAHRGWGFCFRKLQTEFSRVQMHQACPFPAFQGLI